MNYYIVNELLTAREVDKVTVLEKIRMEHKLSHKQMIESLGVSKAYYSMLRSGSRPVSKAIADKLKAVFVIQYEVSFLPNGSQIDNKPRWAG